MQCWQHRITKFFTEKNSTNTTNRSKLITQSAHVRLKTSLVGIQCCKLNSKGYIIRPTKYFILAPSKIQLCHQYASICDENHVNISIENPRLLVSWWHKHKSFFCAIPNLKGASINYARWLGGGRIKQSLTKSHLRERGGGLDKYYVIFSGKKLCKNLI